MLKKIKEFFSTALYILKSYRKTLEKINELEKKVEKINKRVGEKLPLAYSIQKKVEDKIQKQVGSQAVYIQDILVEIERIKRNGHDKFCKGCASQLDSKQQQ